MKVSDVMSKQVDSVRPTDRVERAVMLIFGRGINGVPVCEGKKVIGVVTEQDILNKFFPTIHELIQDSVHESSFEAMEEKAATILSLPVLKIMSKRPTTVAPDTPILRAQSLMNVKNIGRLPVVDEQGRILGIVSKGDVFRSLIGGSITFTENVDYNDFLSRTYYSTVDWNDRLKHELPDLLKVFRQHTVKTVLDVGCGTGDHSIELAKHGFTVVGVDRSASMISEANRRKVGLSNKTYGNVHFWHKDTDDLLYDLDVRYDAILFMGNTLSHNPDNYRHLIKAASNSLSDNGVMIFQITNFEKVLRRDKRMLSFNFVPTTDVAVKEYCFVEFYDYPINKTILKSFIVLESDGKRWKSSGIRNSLMAYTDEKRIVDILKNEGFTKIQTFGGFFDGRHWDYLFRKPFKSLESDWLNVVASNRKS
ncbi:MAG: CBS domain-containing protein [Candidatus Levybacteria bacterium]|nr:CBS domain-containing protein [Candidatus Levybacteria bacterium]